MKKVLLLVVDALASRIVIPAMESGQLSMMSQLAERGVLRENCTSIFPSITPAATASITTGVYPVDHGIAGAFWYDEDAESVAYFGDDMWVIFREGMNDFFNDLLVHLNSRRLSSDTLYQRIERHGHTAAAINFMWFQGETQHEVNPPLLFKLVPGIRPASHVMGPKILGLADFACSEIPGRGQPLKAKGGITRRFGFHDDTTADYLQSLTAADPFPEFTLAYFPNNDFVSHKEGPAEALKVIRAFDQHLTRFIESMGGVDQLLEDFVVVIIGDHSQCDMVPDVERQGIRLDELLDNFTLAAPGTPWKESDDLMVCPNMRAANIYLHQSDEPFCQSVIGRLLSDPRVDQVLWRESSGGNPESHSSAAHRNSRFHVVTSDRGRLSFEYAADADQNTATDCYGNVWSLEGDLSCIDATLHDTVIEYNDYPNALERIASAFCQSSGDLWVTAREGHEFCLREMSINNGGSHGALNKGDSTTSLIVAGLPAGVTVPNRCRTIDIAPMVLRCLDLDAEAAQLIEARQAGTACHTESEF